MRRLFLIGLDGAEPSLVETWMAEGQLPHLQALAARGTFIPCASTVPPATFPAWTTCVTGVNPGVHGIFDFTHLHSGAYRIQFVNATWRRAPALWNILSDAGKRVCVLGVPATYPPDKINGCMVAGFDSPVCTGIDRSFVYPRDWFSVVRDWPFADFQETNPTPDWHAVALAKLLDGIATKERIAVALLEKEPWDFFMIVFGESDTVSHHFWQFHDSRSPRHGNTDAGFAAPENDPILQVYQRLDAAVGRLVKAADENTTIMVVSDHGFGGSGTGVVHMNNWLAAQGDLTWLKGRRGGLLKEAALRLAPESWRDSLFRRFAGLAAQAESAARVAGIDWPRTRAWSEELNYFPSVRINVRGREPQGVVEASEYENYRARLCQRLEEWFPIHRAWKREELYTGSQLNRAPDIILELALDDGYSHSFLRSQSNESFRRLAPNEYLGGKEKGMAGNHRPTGIFFLSKRSAAGAGSLLDVAPTVLAEMGVAGPPMEGTPLVGSHEETVVTTPLRSQQVYSRSEEAEIERRLRNLGYFE